MVELCQHNIPMTEKCIRCSTILASTEEWAKHNGEFTGGSVDYYKVPITHPTSQVDTYTAECNDIIEALGMNFAEGNVFKAIWRTCASRQGKRKRGHESLYDAEKIEFFAHRMVEQAKRGN